MLYRTITVIGRGGIDQLRILEHEERAPDSGEACIEVLASPVCRDDVEIRRGNRPFLAKLPFVPGYAAVGTVRSVGPGVSEVAPGDRVAAFTNYGSHSELLYWPADRLVHVPGDLDLAEVAALMLNYLTAYGCLHDAAGVKRGDRILVIGASGGVGTAFLQLGRAAGLVQYGLASAAKHEAITRLGATSIDYRTQDFVSVLRKLEPEGLDYVFNGMGPEYFRPGLAVLRRGGVLVHYGGPRSMRSFLRLVLGLIGYTLWPNGKRIRGFGTHRGRFEAQRDAWQTLFEMLRQRTIEPVIAERYALLDAIEANRRLESGEVTGTIVLLAPHLL